MLNEHGVVAGESDEMEGRIETGNAKLSTSNLYYDALEMSISLAKSMGNDKKRVKAYQKRRKMALRKIHAFGQEDGFDIEVNRKGGFMVITILGAGGRTLAEERCQEGEIVDFKF